MHPVDVLANFYKAVHKPAEKMKETGSAFLAEAVGLCSFISSRAARQRTHILEDICIPDMVSVHCCTWVFWVQITKLGRRYGIKFHGWSLMFS